MIEVNLRDNMGTDLSVVNGARVSFGKFKEAFDADKDKKLIEFLARHGHWTPFGHCFATFHIKCPIFVRSQLVRHTVGVVVNEISRRYVDFMPEVWQPEKWRKRAENKKQGSSEDAIPSNDLATKEYRRACDLSISIYDHLLKLGVCPEQARAVLPQGVYTEFIWSGSLAAWARICRLRMHSDAQAETRQVAEGIAYHCSKLWPISWTALTEGVKE